MRLSERKNVSDIFKPVEKELAHVNEIIAEQLVSLDTDSFVSEALLTFHLCRGGKMIRPALVLLSGACCGHITDDHLSVAAIIEIIHNATLLHDDVMDQGQKRRGLPTVNVLKGNEYAVLLGDFLLSMASVMCADLPREINSIIASTSIRVCQGEIRQTARRNHWQLTEDEYIDIITEKSASLFSCCCRAGSILSKAEQTQRNLLTEFGLNVGIAFQITDDMLDITGSEQKTGKTLGSDVSKNKLTLPLIHLLRTVDKNERNFIINRLSPLNKAGFAQSEIADMLKSRGSLKYARDKAHSYACKAIQALDNFNTSPAKQALIETAEFSASRSR